MSDEMFPIQDGPAVPMSVMLPHEGMCLRNHSQSIETLKRRGGLCSSEAYAAVHGIAYRDITPDMRQKWFEYAEKINSLDNEINRLKLENEQLKQRYCAGVFEDTDKYYKEED